MRALCWGTIIVVCACSQQLAAEPSARLRVYCRPAAESAESRDVSDSTEDLRKALRDGLDSVELAESPEGAELIVEIISRATEMRSRMESRPLPSGMSMALPVLDVCAVVKARVLDGADSRPVSGENCNKGSGMQIGAWSSAAWSLASDVSGYASTIQERVLLLRPDIPGLGAEYETLTPELRKGLGIKKGKGVVITAVPAGGPAENAGLRVKDVVVAIGSQKVNRSLDVTRELAVRKAGDSLALAIEREGGKSVVTVTLSAREPASEMGTTPASVPKPAEAAPPPPPGSSAPETR